MSAGRSSTIILIIPVLCALLACTEEVKIRKMTNIILITLDTTRADHLGCYGYYRDTSPAIDRFAEESILFERCLVPMATTLPSHISILTSSYPLEHGVLANFNRNLVYFPLSQDLSSIATICADAGYITSAFVSAAPLKKGSGIENGFQFFDQTEARERSAERTTSAALDWLDKRNNYYREKKSFFLWIHYFDPHYPFRPPAPFDSLFTTNEELETFIEERRISNSAERYLTKTVDKAREVINGYDGEIRYMDEQLDRLFDRLRNDEEWDDTAVLLIGDHGEGLCQHALADHGGVWNEHVQAPMMIRVAGENPRRVAYPVSAVDAIPTLLGLIESPELDRFLEKASGHDAFAEEYQKSPVLSQDSGQKIERPDYHYALTTMKWKYVWAEDEDKNISEQLYDLEDDPYELKDVCHKYEDVVNALRDSLDGRLLAQRQTADILDGGIEPEAGKIDSTLIEQLRSLGYVEY